MWKGTGRSGIGDQTIIGEYDDWDGLSMNGRQWKNRITKETRDLSGADYWHQRKALEPKMPDDIPTFVNGKANVEAFRDMPDKPATKPKTKRSAFSQACLSDNNYERLQRISESLDDDLESGVLSVDDWNYAKRNLQPRIDRAWARIVKNRGWDDEEIDGFYESPYQPQESDTNNKSKKSWTSNVECNNVVVNSLSDDNIFRQAYLMIVKLRGMFR